jgi:hypothetical protein
MSTWKPWFAWCSVWIEGHRVWGRWIERTLFDEYHTGPQWRYRRLNPNDGLARLQASGGRWVF